MLIITNSLHSYTNTPECITNDLGLDLDLTVFWLDVLCDDTSDTEFWSL